MIKPFYKAPPTWTDLKGIGNSNLAKLSILVPIVGYMVLFNDELVKYLRLSGLYVWQEESESSFRLFFFYFGLSFVGVASFLFQARCPSILKQYSMLVEYVEREQRIISPYRLRNLIDLIEKFYNRYKNRDQWMSPYQVNAIEAILNNQSIIDDNATALSKDIYNENIQTQELELEALKSHYYLLNISEYRTRLITSVIYLIGFGLLLIPTIDVFFNVCIAFFARLFA